MQVQVKYLENLKLEALFDDYRVISDQPVRYKGDGTAPGPFDYFLASSAMCAAYFVLVYCKARNIPTEDISISQNNIIDPENRYKQKIVITLEIPESISQKDRDGMIASIDRCTVKRVVQNNPDFILEAKTTLKKQTSAFDDFISSEQKSFIKGKEKPLEESLKSLFKIITDLGIELEVSSWRNPVPHVWSVHIRDADSPMCYTNGKGTTKEAALCSALGEYIERLSCNYFYADYYLGEGINKESFVHYPNEVWIAIEEDDLIPPQLMDDYLREVYHLDGELTATHLLDTNSGRTDAICALPYIRQSDLKEVLIPTNIIGNLFVSNGMSAGNSKMEARVQALSEIFERAIKNKIILEEIALPNVPDEVLNRFPNILTGIDSLREKGYPIFVKDASLGGKYPVLNITLMNPKTGGVFSSFGAHPSFEVSLERCLTELLQGRSFEGLNDFPPPTLNPFQLQEHNNIVEHFVDSSGIISWRFFQKTSDFEFVDWNFEGNTDEEFEFLMKILNQDKLECYIADYKDLGANACRILVPNFSEIYQKDDLLWDNNNKALYFRERILNIHSLDDTELEELANDLDDSGIDNHMPITELIGVIFEETSPWGQSVIAEIKAFCRLKLKHYEEARMQFEELNAFFDGTIERKKFYQAMVFTLSAIDSECTSLEELLPAFKQMYGENLSQICCDLVSGELSFFGLDKTDMNLKNNIKHQKLIESYKKLHAKRAASFND